MPSGCGAHLPGSPLGVIPRPVQPHRSEARKATAWKLGQLRLVVAVAVDAIPRAVRHLRGEHDSEDTAARVRVLPDVPADNPRSDRDAA